MLGTLDTSVPRLKAYLRGIGSGIFHSIAICSKGRRREEQDNEELSLLLMSEDLRWKGPPMVALSMNSARNN